VNDHIGKMMHTWIHPEKLNIEHMGDPGNWMPIGSIPNSRKRPLDTLKIYSMLNRMIVYNVIWVIIVDEIKTYHLPINYENSCCKQ
jgi:hypothetical protein